MFSSGEKNKTISQDFRQFELNIKIYFLFLYIKKLVMQFRKKVTQNVEQ